MSPDPLSIIWPCADIPDPVLTREEVGCLSAPVFDSLISLGLLKQADTARHVTCLDCMDQHVEEVLPIKSPNGCTRFFIQCHENGRIEVSRERLLQWTVDYTPLQQALKTAFSVIGDPEEVAPGRIWNLGRAALGSKSRTLWMARGLSWSDSQQLKEVLPKGRSPVLFFLGQPPMADLMNIPSESMIDFKTIVHIEGGKLSVDVDSVDSQLRQENAGLVRKKTPPRMRARRTALIDALKQELRKHLRAARDHAYATRKKTGIAELLPRPTQKHLAAMLNTDVSNISRAINDGRDRELKLYWDGANNLSQVMAFKK